MVSDNLSLENSPLTAVKTDRVKALSQESGKMLIDIHAHVCDTLAAITQGEPLRSLTWGKARIGNKKVQFFPPSFEHSNSPVEMLIAHMDVNHVDKAILMANPYYGYTNDYFIESVQKYPDRLKAVALVDILKGRTAARELAWIYDNTPLFGFKIETDSTFQCARDKHMADADLLPVWDVIDSYHQPCFIHMFTSKDIEDLHKLAEMFPHITFVICHMGADSCFAANMPAGNFDDLIQLVHDNPKVYFDTSTVPVYFDEEYPFPSSAAIIRKAYDKVGAEKMMWSSDYPGMLNHATYEQLIHLTDRHTGIPQKDLDLIMGENARRLFFS